MSSDYSAGLAGASMQIDPQGLDRLRAGAREQSPEALREAARQFEALFIHMMLKNVRETGFGDGVFDSEQGKLYQGMFDQQVAMNMAQGGGLGLADLLVRQLGGMPEEAVADMARSASIYAGVASAGRGED